MAEQKVVVMLQEESVKLPVDYRDVVQTYTDPDRIPALLERPIRQVVEMLQLAAPVAAPPTGNALEDLDLGDTAAENEILGLQSYFVPTGQFRQAKQGHARLVVGRKGTGKTAMFYEVRNSLGRANSTLVLDLKPEGHHFTKLNEAVLQQLSIGLREHTLTAFWNYILLCELAHKVLRQDVHFAERDPERLVRYRRLQDAYEAHKVPSEGDPTQREGDLSQRLLRQIDRLTVRFGRLRDTTADLSAHLTELVYGGDIKDLDEAVSEYLQEKDEVWLLLDNLDKGWRTRGTASNEILVIQGLLEASRKVQRQLDRRGVAFRCLIFLRNDIYEHLVDATPDKGKDTCIRLDWDDRDVFREIVRRRIEASTDLNGPIETVWPRLVESHIGAEDSFNYMLDRTMMRPRDLLTFLQRAIEVALNRGHTKVTAHDIRQAELSYSEDMLRMICFEIRDTHPEHEELVYAFIGCDKVFGQSFVEEMLFRAHVPDTEINKAIEVLLWFGVLGITDGGEDDERYSYQVRYNLRQLLHPIRMGEAQFVLHPALRAALGVRNESPGLF